MDKPILPNEFVVIEGNIGAGKTTLSQLLSAQFDCDLILEEFSDNPFLPLFYKDQERYALMVELYFMAERHAQLTPLSQPSLFSKPVLADYIFLKTWLFARQTLKTHELNLFKKLFTQLQVQLPLPKRIIYIHRPVDVLLQNIAKRGRPYEKDISEEYLRKIQQTYWDYFREEKRFPILMVDLKDYDVAGEPKLFEEFKKLVALPANNGLTVIDLKSVAEI